MHCRRHRECSLLPLTAWSIEGPGTDARLPLARQLITARSSCRQLQAPGHGSETVRPGNLMVPTGQCHVMISMVSRPACTAGSASASCRARASEPVR